MQDHFKILEWDSKFFDVKTAQIKKNLLLRKNREEYLDTMAAANVELAYYKSDSPLNKDLESPYFIQLVSKKVSLKKKLSSSFPLHENVHFYDDPVPSRELIDLAHRAANFSRFLSDAHINCEKVKELYEIWITKSVQKEMASAVLVYKDNDEIKGFVTLLMNAPQGQTPLFAVSRDSEGKGVSFALMRAADSVLYESGCTYYTSATQADNKAAVTVFKRHGCEIGPVEFFYHLWKKGSNQLITNKTG